MGNEDRRGKMKVGRLVVIRVASNEAGQTVKDGVIDKGCRGFMNKTTKGGLGGGSSGGLGL